MTTGNDETKKPKTSKPSKESTASGADLRWWLTQGAECCDVCSAPVHAEAVAHCKYCDRALCPLCRQDITELHIVLCPDCAGMPPEEQH